MLLSSASAVGVGSFLTAFSIGTVVAAKVGACCRVSGVVGALLSNVRVF